MPYRVTQGAGSCSGYAVVVTTTGRVVGCHPSRERATRHLRALYANVPEAREKAGMPHSAASDDSLAAWEDLLEDDAYWAAYERQMIRAAEPLAVAIFMAGAQAALRTPPVKKLIAGGTVKMATPAPRGSIPTEAQLRRAGLTAVRAALAEWGDGLTKTSKDAIMRAVAEAKRTGRGADWVAGQIRPFFSANRARAIAVTEVTRFFTAGAMETYNTLGLEYWVWQTVEDDRVCDICTSLQAESLSTPYHLSEASTPPNHVLCRCFPRPADEDEIGELDEDEAERRSA